MPIPDTVIFGPSPDGTPVTYGDIRALDCDQQLASLKRRLDLWLIGQSQQLSRGPDGVTKVYSPFPLSVMTCVACEATGQVFYGNNNREAEGTQRDCFMAVAKALHPHFSR